MIIVVASCHDEEAREIVGRREPQSTSLLTCEDLSTCGWQHQLFHHHESSVVASGRVISEKEISGVLVRRFCIFERELLNIATADREYVAAEMNAFLASWLSQLSCPVLNRPSGTNLCGPNWRPLQWARAALCAGFRVEPKVARWRVPEVRRRESEVSKNWEEEDVVEVTVIGDRCLGAAGEAYLERSRELANLAGTGLLSVRFVDGPRGPYFLSANPIPALKDPKLAQVVFDYLSGQEG